MDVEHALRRAGRPAGVSDEERVFAVERFRVEASGLRRDELLPPDVPPLVPRRRVVPEPGPHQDALDAHDVVRGTICDLLHRHGTTTPHRAVRGDGFARASASRAATAGRTREMGRAPAWARHDAATVSIAIGQMPPPLPTRAMQPSASGPSVRGAPIGDPTDMPSSASRPRPPRGSIRPDVDALMRHVGLPPRTTSPTRHPGTPASWYGVRNEIPGHGPRRPRTTRCRRRTAPRAPRTSRSRGRA